MKHSIVSKSICFEQRQIETLSPRRVKPDEDLEPQIASLSGLTFPQRRRINRY